MSVDIATLGVKVDASEADEAGNKLEQLAQSADKADASTAKLSRASEQLQSELNQTVAAANGQASALSSASSSADKLANSNAGAARATDEMADRMAKLKASVDPIGAAIDRVNSELAEAAELYRRGAISADEYAKAQLILTNRSNDLAAKQDVMNARLIAGGGAARLTASEALNLSRQFADVGVSAAMGMNPLMILIQQGPQISDIMRTSGLSVKDLFVQLGLMMGLLKEVPGAANAAGSAIASSMASVELPTIAGAVDDGAAAVGKAANAAANVAVKETAEEAVEAEAQLSFAFMGAGSASTVAAEAATVQSIANKAVEETAEAAARAEAQLALASGAASAGAGTAAAGAAAATAANGALAASATAAGAASTAAGAATAIALAPLALIIGAIVLAIGAVAAGFAMFASEAGKNVGDLTKGMGLTEQQLDRLKDKGVDTSITMGDAFLGFFDTVSELIYEAFGPQIEWLKQAFKDAYEWIKNGTVFIIKAIIGGFVGAVYAIREAWNILPATLSDIGVSAANGVIKAVNWMVDKAIEKLNGLIDLANTASNFIGMGNVFGKVTAPQIGLLDNPNAGAASSYMSNLSGAFNEGYGKGSGFVDDFGGRWEGNSKKRGQRRIKDAAGDDDGDSGGKKGGKPKKGDKPEKSEAEKEYEKRYKAAEDYIKSLQEETNAIGKNRVELKMLEVQRAADAAATDKQKASILAQGEAWKKANNEQATKELKQSMADEAEAINFENSLIGKNNAERETAIILRERDLKIRDLERQGIVVNTAELQAETDALIAQANARGQRQDAIDNQDMATTKIRDMADSIREATESFGELFGTAGEGFSNMINLAAEYQVQQEEMRSRQLELQQQYMEGQLSEAQFEFEKERIARQSSQAQISYYGNMLGAAKTFFKEGSTGWKIMEAAERVYRVFQFAMAIKSMLIDKQQTVSSVANSGTRATADGIAGVAKTIASLPFPFNIAAGAAVAAFLVSMGVKMLKGGGGGKGGSSSSANTQDNAKAAQDAYFKNATYDEYGNPTSSYSVLKPGETTVAASKQAAAGVASTVAANDNAGAYSEFADKGYKAIKDIVEKHSEAVNLIVNDSYKAVNDVVNAKDENLTKAFDLGYSVLSSLSIGQTDNAAVPNSPSLVSNANSSSITFGDTNLTIQGDANEETVAKFKQLLDENKQETVQEARQAVAEDLQEQQRRQRLGGG